MSEIDLNTLIPAPALPAEFFSQTRRLLIDS
jgi:hypothetical protein